MGRINLSVNDGILALGMAYGGVSAATHWHDFDACPRPMNLWLVVSLGATLANRISHFLGQYLSDEALILEGDEPEEFQLYSSPHGPPRWLRWMSLGALLPFFVGWTCVGAVWFDLVLKKQPLCFSPESNTWVVLLWLVMCYMWSSLYVLFLLVFGITEYRAREAERNFAIIENEALLRRWGYLRNIGNMNFPLGMSGLPPHKIASLPYVTINSQRQAAMMAQKHGACPICLDAFAKGEDIRKISPCKHVFHRCCIDLWFLRSTSCPNCKASVRSGSNTLSLPSAVSSNGIGSLLNDGLEKNDHEQLMRDVAIHLGDSEEEYWQKAEEGRESESTAAPPKSNSSASSPP